MEEEEEELMKCLERPFSPVERWRMHANHMLSPLLLLLMFRCKEYSRAEFCREEGRRHGSTIIHISMHHSACFGLALQI